MKVLGLSALLLLISTSYGQDNTTALATGLVANPTSTSAVIAFPSSCQYSSQTAKLFLQSTKNESFTFTLPQCRLKRDVVVIDDPQSGNVQTVNVGYQLQNLTPKTDYKAYYVINGQRFSESSFTTLNGFADNPPNVFARSGGMVVITVLLSIAMFLLLVGLVAILFLGRGKK